MKTIKILTAVALLSTVSATAIAEDQSWFGSMTDSVKSWFNANPEQNVETYLDEVTIAVPPMTADQAAEIQPAAGDYQPTLEEALEVIPGSIADDEQSFNTEFSNESGSVAAFEDSTLSADDLANIMPAAGDAEEITDEAVIVVEDTTTEVKSEMAETMAEFAEETQDIVETETAMDAMVEKIEAKPMKEAVSDVVEENMPTTETIAETATEAATDAVAETVTESMPAMTTDAAVEELKEAAADAVEGAIEEAIEPATGEINDAAKDAVKDKMKDMMSY